MRRQLRLGFGVRKIVADVSEERPARREFLHRLQGPLHGGMRGMRAMPQRVQEEHIQALQQLHGFFRNIAVIG